MTYTPPPTLVENVRRKMFEASKPRVYPGNPRDTWVWPTGEDIVIAALTASGLGDAVALLQDWIASWSSDTDDDLRRDADDPEVKRVLATRALLRKIEGGE